MGYPENTFELGQTGTSNPESGSKEISCGELNCLRRDNEPYRLKFDFTST